MRKIIHTISAPQAIGPYSQAILINGTLYTSGQIALNAATGELDSATISAETSRIMTNLNEVLTAAGFSFANVVKTTIFLKDMDDFETVNLVYSHFFDANFPARETVQVAKLPMDVNVEISMIAVRD